MANKKTAMLPMMKGIQWAKRTWTKWLVDVSMKEELDATSGYAPLYAVASIQSQSAIPYYVESERRDSQKEMKKGWLKEKGKTQTTAPERYERNSSRNFPMVQQSCCCDGKKIVRLRR